MFYQEHLENPLLDESSASQIDEYFRSKDSGEILYLYNNSENHLQHAMNFLLSGAEKKNGCLFIDDQKNRDSIHKILGAIITDNEVLRHIHFVNKEEIDDLIMCDALLKLPASQTQCGELKHFRIWLSEEPDEKSEWTRKLENYLTARNVKLNQEKVLFVRSYNAALITAGRHIKMMRNYPYLMTDYEIVDSPFYKAGNKPTIFPSLFIQENS